MADTQTWQDILGVDDVRDEADFADMTTDAIQSQYAHAKRIRGVAEKIRQEIDATQDMVDLHGMVADMQTAQGVYLDWWGQRVGVDRLLKVNGEWYRFDDDYFRFLLMYRAVCNVSDSTCATMNRMLSRLTDTKVFAVDYQNMQVQSIVVVGSISDLQATVLQEYGLLNRPAGVLTNFLIIYPDEKIFGFEGSDLLPFDQGVFNPGRAISGDKSSP
nr:MAG TPA: Protein of unknown function (DUF2612) [Caudoviricetes sp.]